jgi:hypothetical protein
MPMVKFVPSPEQREVVAALSAAKMPLEKIAASIVNPRTQRAISVKTLGRMFKDQLDEGTGVIVEAFRGLKAALEAREAWAVRYVLDNVAGLKLREKDLPQAVKQEIMTINVTGVVAPFADAEPMPEGNVVELMKAQDPMRQIPRYDAFPLDSVPAEPEPAIKPAPVIRTELDEPGYWGRRGGYR